MATSTTWRTWVSDVTADGAFFRCFDDVISPGVSSLSEQRTSDRDLATRGLAVSHSSNRAFSRRLTAPANSVTLFERLSGFPHGFTCQSQYGLRSYGGSSPVVNRIVYDEFEMSDEDAVIQGLTWVGGYTVNFVSALVHSFTITFYQSNSSGGRGTPILNVTIARENASERFLGNQGSIATGGTKAYNYSVTLPIPLAVDGYTAYWLSIVANLGFPPKWGWYTALGASSCQDHLAFSLLGVFLNSTETSSTQTSTSTTSSTQTSSTKTETTETETSTTATTSTVSSTPNAGLAGLAALALVPLALGLGLGLGLPALAHGGTAIHSMDLTSNISHGLNQHVGAMRGSMNFQNNTHTGDDATSWQSPSLILVFVLLGFVLVLSLTLLVFCRRFQAISRSEASALCSAEQEDATDTGDESQLEAHAGSRSSPCTVM